MHEITQNHFYFLTKNYIHGIWDDLLRLLCNNLKYVVEGGKNTTTFPNRINKT